jgi:sugar O-acyltransferase (sialic acid O-acetyltransferase NeuD family)
LDRRGGRGRSGGVRGVVIFGVGSPLVADLEEGLQRAETPVAAAVANVPGDVHLLDRQPLLGRDEVTADHAALPYLVPLFTPANRRSAAQDAQDMGFSTPFSFVDPTSVVPQSLAAEDGLWINAGVTVGAASEFGPFALVNRGASVGHHARLGAFASIGPSAVLAGSVRLGDGVAIGAGATILPEVTVGAHALVGAGSVVTRDIPERCLAMGNPARVTRDDLPGWP